MLMFGLVGTAPDKIFYYQETTETIPQKTKTKPEAVTFVWPGCSRSGQAFVTHYNIKDSWDMIKNNGLYSDWLEVQKST